MPIYKKPNGTYQLYWRKGNQNVYKTFDKKSSANLYEKKLIEKLMKLQTLFMDNYKCWKSIIVDGEYYKKGDVPPPHYHPNDEQWIYLLSGKLAVLLGDETTTAESGDLVYIPRNTIHGIRVLGDECVFFTCKNKSGEGGLSEDYTGVDNLEELIEKLAKQN